LIFSRHVHAFTFLVLLFFLLADHLASSSTLWPYYTFITAYWIAYPWMAMRTAYGQGILMTTFKYLLQSLIYVFLLTDSIITVSLTAFYWF
jgi:hypothetical protein